MNRRCFFLLFACCGLWMLAGCTSLPDAQTEIADAQYGHRYAGQSPEGRETVLIRAPEADVSAYEVFPAAIDSVYVRVAEAESAGRRPVDVLVKGAFPDGCMELHALEQKVAPAGTAVDLQMRRPKAAICTQVVRPYRFYFALEGTYTAGAHRLSINGRTVPFTVN